VRGSATCTPRCQVALPRAWRKPGRPAASKIGALLSDSAAMYTLSVLPSRAALVLAASALLPLTAFLHGAAASILPEVPDIKAVTDYRPKIPLRVYTADKVLIGEFGAERREFVPIARVPALV